MQENIISPNSSKIFVLPEKCMSDGRNCSIITLLHPRTQEKTKFLISSDENKTELFELNQYTDDFSSWFINEQTVKSDGTVYIVTPLDPLFMCLPALCTNAREKFVPLDQLFSTENGEGVLSKVYEHSVANVKQLDNICDSKSCVDFFAYRYNETKTLEWLKIKVERTVDALKSADLFIGDTEGDAYTRYAYGLICENINADLAKKLAKHLKIPERMEKRKSSGNQPNAKKVKTEATEDYSKLVKSPTNSENKNLTRAQKALKKVDKSGMKNISSFFGAKPKKK
ncbi:ribonuclease H2 subunit B [Ciona intestinalis]